MQTTPTHIHREQVKLLYHNFKVIIPGNFLVGLTVVTMVWDVSNKILLAGWFLLLSALLAARYFDSLHFKQALQKTGDIDPVAWEKHFFLGIFLTGILWGTMFWMAFLPEHPTIILFVVCIYAGLVSAGIATSSARIIPFISFSASASLPLIISMILNGTEAYVVMGFTCLAFMITSILIAQTYTRAIRESIRLRYQNMELVERLEEEKERAEQAVVIKDKFLAAASHDLRQPLHAQGLYLDAIEPHIKPSGHSALEALCKTSEALTNLFNSLLDVSRLNAGIVEVKRSHLSLTDMAQALNTEYRPNAAEKGLAMRTECEDLAVFADPILLERILRNLLTNAIRYTRQGTITLSCQAKDNKTVTVAVSDTGIGIPQHELKNIFTEYYQLANSERDRHKGLGLGLAIVKKLCELMDLKLECQSEEGKGSTFSIDVLRGDPGKLPSKERTETGGQQLGKHILVIDDEEEILSSTALLLEGWGCQVMTAESEDEALDKLRRETFEPELIIADYRLPEEKTGAQAIVAVREHCNKNIPAMIVTGDTNPDRLQEAKASGLFLLHKPVAPGKLKIAVRRLALKATQGAAPP